MNFPPKSPPRIQGLAGRNSFSRVQECGKKIVNRHMVMYWLPCADQARYRIGISVRKALGGAVQRNRARRVVREIVRRIAPTPPPGADAIFYVKKDFLTSAFGDAEQEMKTTLEAAHVWNKN